MLDAVVSFLWADSVNNEMMLGADGSMPSSFVSTVRPFQFIGGLQGVCTPDVGLRLRRDNARHCESTAPTT